MARNDTVLVLGATGGIGGEVARQLCDAGWQVRALKRGAAEGKRDGITWFAGDAMDAQVVQQAAKGCSVIVHAVNPPGYRNWGRLVLPMLNNAIAAARANHARIVLPGTVYNFGPDAFPDLHEDSPQNPITVKGGLRVEMERRLRVAATEGASVLIVRAGDFFGPLPGGSWFSQGLVKPGKPVAAITYPGRSGVGHQWAYLPDVAETVVRLLEKADALEPFATFHMDGHWDADGAGMIEAIRAAAGNPRIPVRRTPWPLIRLLSPVVPLFRELAEMRYLWRAPIRMDNRRLKAMLGEEPHTPLDVAVRATLVGIGCLPAVAAAEEGVPAVRRLSS